MGTNYHCRRIDKHKRKSFLERFNKLAKDFNELINDNAYNYEKALNLFIDDSTEDFETTIHLGKKSAGWQFLWDYHKGRYFEPTLNSIKKFLSQKDILIYNEYNEVFTVEEFFKEIENSLYKDKNHADGSETNLSYVTEPHNWDKYYFTSDGLRFSKFEDFS